MKLLNMKSAVLAMAAAHAVDAHTVFTNFYVDGANQGPARCVRMSKNVPNATFYVSSLASDDMACGVDGNIAVERVCPANTGSTLTFEWHDRPDDLTSGAIDPSHKGPCAVYMKKVDSAVTNDTASGNGWFKIYAADYNNVTSKWCTEDLIANNGLLSVKIPSDIQGGYYLVRPELLALHQANHNPPVPQFYTGCAQVFLTSSGSAIPGDTVSIPGYVDMSNPAMSYNIYEVPLVLPYPAIGPPVYVSTSKRDVEVRDVEVRDVEVRDVEVRAVQQTEGLKPAGCVLDMGNWCGMELDNYSTSDGCWNASQICWNEGTNCYSSAGPTGDADCKIWDEKCQGMDDACNAGNFYGPPNAGKDLTPPFESPNVPALAVETMSTYGAQATGASGGSYSVASSSVTVVAYMATSSSSAAAYVASTSTSAAAYVAMGPTPPVGPMAKLVHPGCVVLRTATAEPLLNTAAPDANPHLVSALRRPTRRVEDTRMDGGTDTTLCSERRATHVDKGWPGGVG
ncbi:MAG: hypothetical protein FRX48_09422 [Lasallia pustulata]|uniref:AA9 family lytic polysaccharide monooxygenase n=1 Tax=Lasallia pustulata TaxID=136370 RepID=A0A5M8PBL8_9LECA|nr:MAG: hypothetical protein FRX48_09422 [Lasallia pustulata]